MQHFIIFGSYVTSKAKPNDVDIILVMDDSFKLKDCPAESAGLFNHAVAQARYGASIFWTRPMALINETVEEFMAYWQSKRDGSQRGIIEVVKKIGGDNDTQ